MNRFSLIVVLCSFKICLAQSTFQKTIGGPSNDEGVSMISTFDGNFIILATESDSLPLRTKILKIDSIGNILWEKIFSQINFLKGCSIKETPDSGFIFVASYSVNSTGTYQNLLIIRINKIGDVLWTNSFTGIEPPQQMSPSEIICTSDGGFAITGWEYFSTPNHDFSFLLKLNSAGALLWEKYYDNPRAGVSLKETSDGGFLICGAGIYQGSVATIGFIKTDSIGNILYTKSFRELNSFDFYPIHMESLSNGGYLITGWNFILLVDSLMNPAWLRYYNYLVCESAKQDGNEFIVVGRENNNSFHTNCYLFKIDSLGNIIWLKKYGGYSESEGIDVKLLSDGYLILGNTANFSHGGKDIYLIKADTLGDSPCHTFTDSRLSPGVAYTVETLDLTDSSGCIVTSSPFTTGSQTDSIFDACICIPPLAYFTTYINPGMGETYFNSPTTWADYWHWDFGDGDTSNWDFTVLHTYSSGSYYPCLTVSNSCDTSTFCDSLFFPIDVSINEFLEKDFKLSPSPTTSFLKIETTQNIDLIELFNLFGENIPAAVDSKQQTVDCRLLPPGIYILQASNGKKVWRGKFIKE